ncbi:hypothetical protein ALI144C_32180 [Actinosynnema sp. ALI-1.44]|nr:hypothetical protein ALI144C_32180 [Actinosynnema sp. ALI-1.44]
MLPPTGGAKQSVLWRSCSSCSLWLQVQLPGHAAVWSNGEWRVFVLLRCRIGRATSGEGRERRMKQRVRLLRVLLARGGNGPDRDCW